MGSSAVTMKPENWRNWSGQTVANQFVLGESLGESEHSIVFSTEIGSDHKKAAIKLIPADPKTADLQLARWKQASQLSHPNLLRILRWGRCTLLQTDLLYVVMEFAEEDVSQILPQRALTPDEARVLLPPVLDALGYLHANGLV